MSIINKMLQDLDRRQGMSNPEATTAIPQVRSVPPSRGDREWFWRIVAALMFAAVGWVAWLAWQLQPRDPVVTALAFKAAENAKRNPSAAAVSPAPVPPPAVAPAVEPVILPPKPVPQAAEIPKQAAEPAPPTSERPKRKPVAMAAASAPKSGRATRLDLDLPPAHILDAPAQSAGRVQKMERVRSPDERAESDFRRGAVLLNQGRVSEAGEAFNAALAHSPSHEAARQALVALNLEQRRIDDARRLLQEGLAIDPANPQFALVLGRIHVERREYALALEVLGGAHAAAQSNPEFRALSGTALQRLERYAEAADAFRSALRGAPNNGQAWAGLAISLDAQGRRPEAIEAFQRALAAAPAGSELGSFIEQRLRALR